MRRPDGHGTVLIPAAASLLVFAGCNGVGGPGDSLQRFDAAHETGPVEPARPAQEVVERVNRNSAGMNFLLRAGGVGARGRYVENSRSESYDLSGVLLYRRPLDLYMELQHTLGGKFEIGSNEQEFWVWKRLGRERYWYGRQAALSANQELDIPLRPTDIVEVLGLGELEVPDRSAFRVRKERYEINVRAVDPQGRGYTAKTITIDRRAPYMVREMTYFFPDGRPRARAALSAYRRVEKSGVLVPHRVQITWPEKGGDMNLEFGTVSQFEASPKVLERFLSPVQRGRDVGPMQRVDQAPPRAEVR